MYVKRDDGEEFDAIVVTVDAAAGPDGTRKLMLPHTGSAFKA